MSEITAAVRADLAPNGRLRVGINYGNAILARKDPATGESSGVAIQLAREIGRRLDAPLDIVPYPGPGPLVDGVKARECDLAFLGSDPAREQEISFTPAYMLLEATYLVKAGSPLRDASEVDREGISVGAPARANYELFLKRMLHKATLKSVENAAAAQALLLSGEVDAMAGLKEALIALAERLPDVRVLEGRFMGVQQSIGVPKGHDAGLAYLRGVVEEAKASGLVARAIDQTGARGVSVAPAA